MIVWESSKAAKLFRHLLDDVYDGVEKKVNLLTAVLNLVDAFKSIIYGEDESLSGQFFDHHNKALYLRFAYNIALQMLGVQT